MRHFTVSYFEWKRVGSESPSTYHQGLFRNGICRRGKLKEGAICNLYIMHFFSVNRIPCIRSKHV